MQGRRILVIGAGGRLGRMMQRAVGLGLAGVGDHLLWASRGAGDLRWTGEPDALDDLLQRAGSLDAVLLLSGQTPGPGVTAESYTALNQALPRLVREACLRHGVGQLCLTSTAAVYGRPADDAAVLDEDAPTAPLSDYGRTKRAMEVEAMDWAAQNSGLRLSVGRIANVAGADQIVANALRASDVAPMQVHRFDRTGRGPLRSYLGPVDLTRGLLALVRGTSPQGEIVNITRDPAVHAEELADAVRMAGLGGGVWHYTPAPADAIERVVMDGSRIAALAGFVPSANLALDFIDQLTLLRD